MLQEEDDMYNEMFGQEQDLENMMLGRPRWKREHYSTQAERDQENRNFANQFIQNLSMTILF